jgi:hypothetical protein
MIDFDEASRCWLENKRRTKSGTYKYTCEHTYKYGKRCGRDVYKVKSTEYCRQHWALSMNYNKYPVLGAGHYGIVLETPAKDALKIFKDPDAPINKESEIQTKTYCIFAQHLPQVKVPRVLETLNIPITYNGTQHLSGIRMEALNPPKGYETQVHTLLGYHGNDIDTVWGMRTSEPPSSTNPPRGFFASPYTLEDIWEEGGTSMTIETLAYLMGRAHRLMLDNGILPIDLEWVWSEGSLWAIDFGLCEIGHVNPIEFLNSESSYGLKNDYYIPHEGDRGYAEFMRGYHH